MNVFILILHVHIEDEGVGKAVFTFSLLIPLREADVVWETIKFHQYAILFLLFLFASL